MRGTTPMRLCGAKTRSGGTCRHRAGYGTDHLGTARCKMHGGSSPSGRKQGRRLEALDFAFGALGGEVANDPLEALLQAVRISSGMVLYWRVRLLPYQGDGEHKDVEPPREIIEGLDGALDRSQKCSKAALDAKVDEKLVQIASRFAERLTLIFEEALAPEKLDSAMVMRLVARYSEGLVRFEGQPIEGTVRLKA